MRIRNAIPDSVAKVTNRFCFDEIAATDLRFHVDEVINFDWGFQSPNRGIAFAETVRGRFAEVGIARRFIREVPFADQHALCSLECLYFGYCSHAFLNSD